MSGRFLLVCGVLLAFANAMHADGTYQPTRNGRTLVWNNHPKPGDVATWSGARDRERYAHGFGELSWYIKRPATRVPKPVRYARYWGNMIRGKFEGPVNVHSQKQTHHAIFVDGARTTRWSPGTAPSQYAPTQYTPPRSRYAIITKPRNATAEPPAPAAGPTSERPGLRQRPPPPEVTASPSPVPSLTDQSPHISDRPKIDIDESIRIVVLPPRSLRWKK